ncbi:hypothetical protein [Paenibacillus nasutitermitis]|uniref:hypothetical protein n=1 Tax=Paenibacillus nasutitermitis TaxID=1652958 RepID=UPI00166439A8|nr:hypothetical protein [Paenibacillus nasutitermitis]
MKNKEYLYLKTTRGMRSRMPLFVRCGVFEACYPGEEINSYFPGKRKKSHLDKFMVLKTCVSAIMYSNNVEIGANIVGISVDYIESVGRQWRKS